MRQGNLTIPEDVNKACEGADCVWHVAALVGPFHAKDAYMAVNYQGSLNVLEACRCIQKAGAHAIGMRVPQHEAHTFGMCGVNFVPLVETAYIFKK